MSTKKLLCGFRGLALAPVTEDTILTYKSEAANAVPYAGSMTRSQVSRSQKFNYDDVLYAAVNEVVGEDLEIRVAEMPFEEMERYGLGMYDEATGAFEEDFTPKPGLYSLRAVLDSIGKLPLYTLWRCFELTGIRYDNHTTKGDNLTACDVIITGTVRRPMMPSLMPVRRMWLNDITTQGAVDNSNHCQALLSDGETFPVPTTGA